MKNTFQKLKDLTLCILYAVMAEKESDKENIMIKRTDNIIKTEDPYTASYHLPDEEYDYFYLDFITYPPGFKRSELENYDYREKMSNKFGKHTFRICFSTEKRIDELIDVLETMKAKHQTNLYFRGKK